MKITDIKQQVKRADRYSIYADGTYVFSLSEPGLLQLGLHLGQEISDAELADLRESASFDKLYDQALRYIAIRLRSEWELEQYLRRKEAAEPDRIRIMTRLRERGWLNDRTFAEAWVSNRRQLKLTNQRRLHQELRAKRVADEIINQVLAADETDEQAVLMELVARKRRQSRYRDDTKLMQYLVRQGFSYDAVKRAVHEPVDL